MKLLHALLTGTILSAVSLGTVERAQATVNSPTATVTATGNSVTTVWNYGFIIPYQAGGSVPAVTVSTTTGGVTTVISPSLYTIAGVGNSAGGTVTYPLVGSPLSSSTTITIARSLAYVQPTAVSNTGFLPHTVETVADNLAMQIQQLAVGGGGGGGGGGSGVSSFNTRVGAITLSSGDVTGALGYTPSGGVSSFNTRTGAVSLTSGDVTTALTYTPLQASNIVAGTGITVTPGGGNLTIAASGAATQTVTAAANVTALRAVTSVTVPTIILQGFSTAGDGGGGTFTYVSTDTTTADNGCTIFVDASTHRWYRNYAGAVNVKWCGAKGDGSTDDKVALQAALATLKAVFIPPSPTCYMTSGSLTISAGQVAEGDTAQTSCIKASTAALPIFIVPVHNDTTNTNIVIKNLKLDRSIAATVGGDGIYFGSYATLVLFDHLFVQNQYNGISLHSTDTSDINNSVVQNNYANGILLTSSSWYPTMQWSMKDVFLLGNNGDGLRATTVAAAGQASVGTLTNLRSFANTGHGVNFIGVDAGDPLQGVRLIGGFFGQDGASEIYLDTYGSGHVIEPSYTELAGTAATGRTLGTAASNVGAGIELSANNYNTEVKCGACNGNSYDGLISSAVDVDIVGGMYTNNGQAAGAAGVGRANGIYINAGTGVISGVKVGNTQGLTTQKYGIAANVDGLSISGGDYRNNAVSYSALPAIVNTVIAGVVPAAMNTGGGGGSFCALSGCTMTGPLQVNSTIGATGTITGTGDITTATSHTTTAAITNLNVSGSAAVTGGVTALDMAATRSLGVGTGASGVSGKINAGAIVSTSETTGTLTSSSDVIANGQFHGNSTSAFASGLTVTGSLTATAGVTALDVQATRSMGVGTGVNGNATGGAGQLNVQNFVFVGGQTVTVP